MSGNGIVVGSANADVGMVQAIDVLRGGGTPLDAVIAGIQEVERNPEDHSVGFSGLPNLLGEVELDASVMEGARLRAGAVGALHRHPDAVQLARRVMEELPHVLVVGEGADRLAAEVGLPERDLLTPEAERIWREGLEKGSPHIPASYLERMRAVLRTLAGDPDSDRPRHGTVNLIARDAAGRIACAVSTSGYPWKYPGRLGDSPIIGAGSYADDRWGAAAATGFGELSMRACTAHTVVMCMRFGRPLREALEVAMTDLRHLETEGEMHLVAIDGEGRHAGASTDPDHPYVYITEEMEGPARAPSAHLPLT